MRIMIRFYKTVLIMMTLGCCATRSFARGPPELQCENVAFAYLHQPSVNITCTALADPQLDQFHVWFKQAEDDVGSQVMPEGYSATIGNGSSPDETVISINMKRVDLESFMTYVFEASNSLGSTNRSVTLKESSEPPRENLLWCHVSRVVEAEAWDNDREVKLNKSLSKVFKTDPDLWPAPVDGQCYNVGQCSVMDVTISGIPAASSSSLGDDTGKLKDQRCVTEEKITILKESANMTDNTTCLPVTSDLLTVLYGDVTEIVTGANVKGTICFCTNDDLCNGSIEEIQNSGGIGMSCSSFVCGLVTAFWITIWVKRTI